MTFFDIIMLDFAQRAFFIGILAAFISGILGTYVVAGRYAIFSDMLAHTSLAGVGIGILFGFSPSLGGLGIALLSAFVLWFFMRDKQYTSDAVTMVLLSGGLALALVLSHFAKNNTISLETFLFGSVLTVRPEEVWYFLGASVCIGTFLLFFGSKLKTIVLDPSYAKSESRISTSLIELFFFLSVAIFVGFSLKIIGGLLIGALLVIAVVTAQSFCKSFFSVLLWSVFFNVLAVIIGIFLSFYLDIPTGPSIVLFLIFQWIFVGILRLGILRFS
ncbi:MAG: metal ABC transporter permease [Candidatus Moraniibacteriota bacterium]|nr:MAG: metal ABC transporter permease [Candidatus Moranbacteria bacterium]